MVSKTLSAYTIASLMTSGCSFLIVMFCVDSLRMVGITVAIINTTLTFIIRYFLLKKVKALNEE